jgi:phosphotransferase system enzyme I (PtsP)
MVLAEMIASGELLAMAKPGAEPAIRPRRHLTGVALADNIALGHVVLHEPRVTVKNVIADDIQKELQRLDESVETMRNDLDAMLERGELADGGEHRDVLEAYRMFAHDQGWLHRLHEAVLTGLTAEAAVERVQSDTRARMLRSTDPYLRERLHDLDDLGNRLMRQLLGQDHAPSKEQLPDNAVLVARSMGPAVLLDYDRKKLRGLVLEEGGPTSHVAIVARALGIAAVGEIPNATGLVESGDAIIVDGTAGDVHVRPPQDIETAYAERAKLRARRQAQYHALRDKPCVTKDGVAVALMINAGLLVDLPHIADTGAAGIGLFRTECNSWSPPHPAHRRTTRSTAVLDAAGDKPVTFRTLDIGGDKVLPYMRSVERKIHARMARDPARPRPARPDAQPSARAAAPPPAANSRSCSPWWPRSTNSTKPKHWSRANQPIFVATAQDARARRDRHHGRGPRCCSSSTNLSRASISSVGSILCAFSSASIAICGCPIVRCALPTDPARRLKIIEKANAGGKPVTLCGELASSPAGALHWSRSVTARFRLHRLRWARSRPCCSISTPRKPQQCSNR